MGDRIETVSGNYISGKGRAGHHACHDSCGCWIINNGVGKKSAEVALSLGKCWHLGLIHERAADSSPLIISKEEKFVANDRSAEGEAELILTEWSFLVSGKLKIILGIEDVIPQELEHGSMILIASRFDGGIDDRSAAAAELR